MADSMRMASLDELRQRTSIKWRQHPPDVLPLTVAEMDTDLCGPVVEAVQQALAISDTGYPAGTGYAEALADFAANRWDWKIDIDRTGIVPDVMLGIVEVLKLVSGPGDFVVVNSPVYEPFYLFLTHMDRHVLEAPLDDDHRIDLATLEAAFVQATHGGRSAAYLLCNPHNPTGTVHRRDELDAVLALARDYGVRIVVDEIHAPLIYPGVTYLPFLSLPGSEDAFSLMSASKAWNLAGLRAALVIAGVGAAADLARMPVEVSHGASHLGVISHTAAFRSGQPWLEQLLGHLDHNRVLLGELLHDELPQVRYAAPEGTYLAWLDCRGLGLGDDPAAAFLERGRVAVVSGPSFGTGGAGHVRVNLATSPDILRDAVHRMAASLT